MKYRKLGNTGVNVSELCLGTATFGGKVSEADSIRLVRHAYGRGVNFFDTANSYSEGRSEEFLGKGVKGFRDQVILTTKSYCKIGPGVNDESNSAFHIMREAEKSLKRLDTDYIDLYQIHWPDWKFPREGLWNRYATRHHDIGERKTSIEWVEWESPPEEPIKAIDLLVRQGKVRYIGCSNYPAWLVCRGLWYSDLKNLSAFVCAQARYNLFMRQIERELLPFCRDQKIGVITYAPLEGGFLSGKYGRDGKIPDNGRDDVKHAAKKGLVGEGWDVIDKLHEIAGRKGASPSQIAIAWILSRPAITAPIIGISRMEQLEDNLGASGLELTQEEVNELEIVSSYFRGGESPI